MVARPGYEQPDPRIPLPNHPHPQQFPQSYQQRRRDYDAESDASDHYGSRNGSTAQLTAGSPYYDHSGQQDSSSEYRSSFTPLSSRSAYFV
jgi:1,3-beta-glucan synthase